MMVKTICTCDRCGKTFDEVNSKSIKIVPARAERKKKNKENKSKYSNILKKRTLLNWAKKNIIALLALKKCEC